MSDALDAGPRRLYFTQLDSTNAEALRRARDGERGPLWIDADAQSAGRGRSGRVWQSASGNLATSYLFITEAPAQVLGHLSLLAGVAVYDAIKEQGADLAQRLQLKWPNDILLNGAKAGGILVESTCFHTATVVIIGIGLNIATAPDIARVATAALGVEFPGTRDLDAVRRALDMSVTCWLRTWDDGNGFDAVRQAWLARGPKIGQALQVKIGNDVCRGRFDGLDSSGALCLLTATGEKKCYSFGDVSLG